MDSALFFLLPDPTAMQPYHLVDIFAKPIWRAGGKVAILARTICQSGGSCNMWWRHTPRTDQERSQEIARLTKKRDHLLDRAPEAVLVRQTIILCFLGLMIFLVGGQIFFQPARSGFIAIFALALFGALLFVFLRGSLNLPSIGDRWGMSRLLGYEGDSPQELQNEIERLRAQMNQADER